MYTTQDIYSHTSGELYAPCGVEVMMVSDHGNVMIVEYQGVIFPCHNELLSDKTVIKIEETIIGEFKLL